MRLYSDSKKVLYRDLCLFETIVSRVVNSFLCIVDGTGGFLQQMP